MLSFISCNGEEMPLVHNISVYHLCLSSPFKLSLLGATDLLHDNKKKKKRKKKERKKEKKLHEDWQLYISSLLWIAVNCNKLSSVIKYTKISITE